MLDFIGDVHGHAAELLELLEQLGYRPENGGYRHATRIAVFVGDLIDRGPEIGRTLSIVRAMHEAKAAWVVMGNHELNALAFHTPHPDAPGRFLREHTEKNVKQHEATLRQLPQSELASHLEWFRQLPMWIERDGVRVVHACWDPRQIAVIRDASRRHGGVTSEFLAEAMGGDAALTQAIEDVLKGKELAMPEGTSYQDKDGTVRTRMRTQWYRAPQHDTYASFALSSELGLPQKLLPDECDAAAPYPDDAAPVFFGHYWLRAEHPSRLAPNVACLDYSVAKGGRLCAYRWDGEQELDDAKFFSIASQPK